MNPSTPEAKPIYVGYLSVPARHRALLRTLLPALGLVTITLACTIAALQRDPGPATWGHDTLTHTGTLMMTPYPVLLPDDEDTPPLLLVASGKFGATDLESFHGSHIQVRGSLLARGEARMLELDPAFRPQPAPGPARPLPSTQGSRVTLRGEIVDSKCCLGAMKPGEGKTHRACATLCIRGGIPPVLVSFGDSGETLYTLLTDSAGQPANDLVLDHIAAPVEITGVLSDRAGVRLLAIERLRPLTP